MHTRIYNRITNLVRHRVQLRDLERRQACWRASRNYVRGGEHIGWSGVRSPIEETIHDLKWEICKAVRSGT